MSEREHRDGPRGGRVRAGREVEGGSEGSSAEIREAARRMILPSCTTSHLLPSPLAVTAVLTNADELRGER